MICDIDYCPRCGGAHKELFFKQFKQLEEIAGKTSALVAVMVRTPWDLWSVCPTSKEPLLMSLGGGYKDQPRLSKMVESDLPGVITRIIDDPTKRDNVKLAELKVVAKLMRTGTTKGVIA